MGSPAGHPAITRGALAALALLVLGAPVGALAQRDSAVDQYREHIPEGGGDRPTREVDGGDDDAVPPSTAQALNALGDAGAAAAELARRTAPERSRRARGADPSDEAVFGGRPPPPAVAGRLGGGGEGGMGVALPAILVGSLVAATCFLFARRRLASGGEEA